MTSPQRIQLSRAKGWRKPEGAIVVARPTVWGNPWRVGQHGPARVVVARYVALMAGYVEAVPDGTEDDARRLHVALRDRLHEIEGRDLACWCRSGQPCHADALLALLARDWQALNAMILDLPERRLYFRAFEPVFGVCK